MNNLDYVTVVVITKNEERNIKRCLESVAQFTHKLVIDSGSTDKTTEIASKHGATIIYKEWLGFGKQKQFALESATTEWVLSMDADEEISTELLNSIKAADLTDLNTGYLINRRSYFLGKLVFHSGWNPDWILRLVNKRQAFFTEDLVHERITGCHRLIQLGGELYHYSYQSRSDVERKIRLYGALGRESRRKNKNPILAAMWAFFRTLILKLGLLDGITGLNIAFMNARTAWIKYSD